MQAGQQGNIPRCAVALQVCECVVILRNLKEVSWQGAKAMMSEGNFLRSLVDFDKDGLTEKQVGAGGRGHTAGAGHAACGMRHASCLVHVAAHMMLWCTRLYNE